jgi:hypothetical protein
MKIEYLADNKQFVPIVCDWFHEEWSYLNPSRTKQQLHDIVESRLTKGTILNILIGTENNELVGTVTLRNDEVEEEATLYPWLSSLYGLSAILCCNLVEKMPYNPINYHKYEKRKVG